MTSHAAIVSLWAIWLAFWVVNSFGNKRTVKRTNPAWRFGIVAVALFLMAVAREYPGVFAGPRLVPHDEGISALAVGLCALGVGIAIWARAVLGRNWSGNPTIKEGHELIRSGPYRFVRHPIYTGLLLAILGTCLRGGRAADIAIFAVVVGISVVKLRIEESLMLEQFPEAYAEYRKQTKALVPYVI
jgi:protein-S-isoprenylcysteine O-methyltransferase Ste14